jgi:hypothetical protein
LAPSPISYHVIKSIARQIQDCALPSPVLLWLLPYKVFSFNGLRRVGWPRPRPVFAASFTFVEFTHP